MIEPPRIGSLFSGYGGLDMAVEEFFGAETAWHCQYEPPDKNGREDRHQYAAAVLAHHYPGIPNLGDLTQVDWDQAESVDILTGGFPCTDVSLAGDRAGLNAGTRSGLWAHMARAIRTLNPKLVVIENVRGLLSAPADGHVEPCTWCVGDTGDESVLRALGAVLADLAELGFDAEWVGVPASAVGAPHERFRVFILAWPATAENPDVATCGERRVPAPGQAEGGRSWSDAGRRGGTFASDPDGNFPRYDGELPAGRDAVQQWLRDDAARRGAAPADASGDGRGEGRPEPTRLGGGPDTPLGGAPDWGPYAAAIARWERAIGVPAPRATDDRGRLSPAFTEWLMGIPGRLTSVPAPAGMTASQLRNAQLKAAGNGVVPQQALYALGLLWDAAHSTV